ncbi:hypothetical protein K3722_07620 [Leisingera caerulea]|uniref:Uracil-DNA glycosylase n=1 Tax=Leisingera caerulea TaxID=506591 RepID=A0ABY5X078_LEICA|nr:hypothetical protein [Leisingera caerulea]UWQ59990.1 hypothetical protein K3722_07620 [Leisingera caerulea]
MNQRRYPIIAPYHSGPYRVAAVLRDPGRPEAGCGAEITGEIGVLNYRVKPNDQTAKNCHAALLAAGLPLTAYLPMNAIPWFDGIATAEGLAEGAVMNAELISTHRIKRVLLFGNEAQRSEKYLVPLLDQDVKIAHMPHPSTRGIQGFRRREGLPDFASAKRAFNERFAQAVL